MRLSSRKGPGIDVAADEVERCVSARADVLREQFHTGRDEGGNAQDQLVLILPRRTIRSSVKTTEVSRKIEIPAVNICSVFAADIKGDHFVCRESGNERIEGSRPIVPRLAILSVNQ